MIERLKERFSGVDPARYSTAGILIIVMLAVLLINSHFLTWLVVGAIYGVAFHEACQLYGLTNPWLYLAAPFAWILAVVSPSPLEASLLILVVFASYQAFTKKGQALEIMPLLYPTLPFVAIFTLYKTYGVSAIFWLIFVVALTDTAAFFGGKLFGKRPFCPTSPNKTQEGVLIGIGVATLIGTLIGLGTVHFRESLLITLLTSIAAVFGDLYESYLKRQAGVKDSGTLFPGHGGVLDRADGFMFAAIVMLVLLRMVTA